MERVICDIEEPLIITKGETCVLSFFNTKNNFQAICNLEGSFVIKIFLVENLIKTKRYIII